MRVRNLTSSLSFGAAAAIALVFVLHLATPRIGSASALALYWVACTVAYAALLGGTPRRALRNAVAALAGAGFVVILAHEIGGLGILAVGLTGVLAFVRSGLEFSQKPGRALVVEGMLGLAALGFASWISMPGFVGAAVSLWGFALVQSLFFLVPGRARARSTARQGDPFDRALERLEGLLEEA